VLLHDAVRDFADGIEALAAVPADEGAAPDLVALCRDRLAPVPGAAEEGP
jgi:hypothetical protein